MNHSTRKHKTHWRKPMVHAPLDPPRPVLDQLEALDDTIFAAIDGDADALDRSAGQWQEAVKSLGPETVEESRRQYLRHARHRWRQLRSVPGHPPHKSFAALEIITLLSGEFRRKPAVATRCHLIQS